MPKYAVVKYFGHFRQDWSVDANTKEEAWNIAESNGYLDYQTAYHEVFDTKVRFKLKIFLMMPR
jgi:hypothetical protein